MVVLDINRSDFYTSAKKCGLKMEDNILAPIL